MKYFPRLLILLLWLAVFRAPCPAQNLSFYLDTTLASIPGPYELAYNPLRQKIYVAMNDTVLGVIDRQYGYTTVTGFNLSYPRYPRYNRSRDVVYVAGTYRIYLIDGQTNVKIDSTTIIGEGIEDLLYDSLDNRLYAGSNGQMNILDGNSQSLLKIFPNYGRRLFHYRPRDEIMAASYYSDSLLVVRDTNRVDEVRIPGLENQSCFAANEARGRVYISLPLSNQVAVMDGNSHALLYNLSISGGPQYMAYCPVTDEIYVACRGSDSMAVIRGDDSYYYIYLGLDGDSISAVGYNHFLQRIYCADENDGLVRIINPYDQQVKTVSLPAGFSARPLALAEGDSGRVFIANSWANSVSVVAWADTTPPYIMGTEPYNNAVNVLFDTPVTVYFSEPIDPGSLNFSCSPDPGGWRAEWDITGRQVTLRHSHFSPGITHAFRVLAARDLAGNDLVDTIGSAPNPWSFVIRSLETASFPWQGGRYQLISLPLVLYDSTAAVFSDDLGAYGPSHWRLFGYNPAMANYAESPFLKVGAGYWLASVSSCTLDVSGYRLPRQNHSTKIPLSAGWNLIGSPYDTLISVASCLVIDTGGIHRPFSDTLVNGLLRQRLWFWSDNSANLVNDGSWDQDTITPLDTLDMLKPWLGYAVYATRACSLSISTPINKSVPARPGSLTQTQIRWRLELAAECQEGRDYVVIGVSPQALRGYDRLDAEKPPAIATPLRFFIPHRDWGAGCWQEYASDFRPEENLIEWPLLLAMDDNNQEVAISYKLEGELPPGFKLFLVERLGQRAVELTRAGRFGFSGRQEFSLLLSDGCRGIMDLRPLSFDLGLPRPNPSSRTMKLDYQLSQTGPMRLAIYNALGQRIRTLSQGLRPPGYYTAFWDGRTDRQEMAPPGVYIVRLEAEGRQAVRKIVRIR